MTEQTAGCAEASTAFWPQAGTDKSKLLSANIWITDMAKLRRDERGLGRLASPGNTPARATVQAGLAAPGLPVEIMVVAAI